MKKTTLRQAAMKLALVALAVLAPLGLRAQQSLPYSYGFEDNDLAAAGWTAQVTSPNSSISSVAAHEGSYGFRFNYSEQNAYLVSPLLTGTDNGVALSFYYKEYSASYGDEQFYVGYTTNETVTDPSAFTYGDITTASMSWQLYETSLPAGTKRVAIKYVYNDAYYLYLDDFTFEAPASCIKPTGLTATLTTGDGSVATLSWTKGGTEPNWVLEYSTASDFSGATTVTTGFTPSGNSVSVNLTGLTPEQTYYARVKANCGGGDESDWSSETGISFTPTNAYSITVNDGTSTNGYIPVYGYYVDGSIVSQFIMPAESLTAMQWGTINKLTFYAAADKNWGAAQFEVYMTEVDYTTFSSTTLVDWTTMDKVMNAASLGISGNQMVVNLDAPYQYTGGNLLIGIKQTVSGDYSSCSWYGVTANGASLGGNNNGSQQNFLPKTTFDYIPGEAPSCLPPTNLAATPSTTSAELSWTANSDETAWTIYYKKTTDENYTEVANATNPYTLNDLTAATYYQFYVVANCAADDASEPSTVFPFATECDVISAVGYSENFDATTASSAYSPSANTLPNCWNFINTCTYSSYQYYPVVSSYSSSSSSNAHSGTNYLRFYSYGSSSSDPQPQYAILPEMSGLAGKFVTLWAKGYNYSSKYKIGTMTDPTDANTFTQIAEQALTTSYQEFEHTIPTDALGNYLAIMMDAASTINLGVYIDDIQITEVPTCRKPSALMLDNPSAKTAHTATLKWTNGEEGQNAWQIAYSTSNSFAPDPDFTPGDNEWLVNADDNPFELTNLNQSTTYYAYVRANCGDEDGVSAWCNTKAIFSTLAGNNAPTDLAVAANTITSTEATATWNAVAGNTQHQSYDIYWAVSTTEAPVTAVPAEPTAPNLISGIDGTSQLISGLNPETQYRVWVRDNCGDENNGGDGYSAWSTYVTFTTASACQTPDGLAASSVTTNSATISWNTYGQTSFNLRYSTDGENWTIVENTNSPYTFNGTLSSNTDYQVQVQATCNTEAWSTTLNFTTLCDAITITETVHYIEDFETPVVTTTYSQIGEMPACWDNYPTTSSSAKILAAGASYNYADNGQVLYFYGSGNNFAALPEFTNALNTLQINFKWATESNSNGSLTLGYITNEDNGTYNTFTAIGESFAAGSASHHQMKSETVYLNTVPAEATRLVFRWYYSSQWGANIDDIEVSLAPSCFPVGTLAAATNVGATSADLSWTLVDNSQNAWVVEYATDEDFTDVQTVDADSHSDFVLNGLTPETHYWVRVKANCGNEDGEVSNVIDFTTAIACAAPTDLTLDSRTTNSLTVSWTENGSASSWTVFYKAEDENDFHFDQNVTENPYTISDLGDGVNYTVKVTANCDNGYPSPELVNVFQTEASCPAPTDVVYSDVTPHGATITWEGEAANHDIEYRTVTTVDVDDTYDFEDGMQDWTTIDADGQGNAWSRSNDSYNAHNGTYSMKATYNSYYDHQDYLVSPQIALGGSISFYAKKGGSYNDRFRVYLSTTSNTSASDFTIELTNGDVSPSTTYSQYSYDLSSYSGMGYVAIVYTAPADQLSLYIDDINITATVVSGYGEWQTVDNATSPHELNNLNPETNYEVRVKGVCGATTSPASNIVGFTTLVACPVPDNFAVDNSTITHNSVDLSWTVIGGTSYVVAYKADGETDFTEVENVTSVPYTLSGLNPETPYTVKVKSDCSSEGYSQWSEEKTFTTIEACAAPTAFNPGTITAHEATFSWTAGNGNTSWQVFVKKHDDTEYPAIASATVTAPTSTATINELDAATVYDVKIVPTCDENKTLEVANAFTTECEAVTISAEGWTENFDNYTGNSTSYSVPSGYPNHTMPTCWKFLNMSVNSTNYPQAFLSTNSGYPVSGNCLFFRSSNTTPIYAILPEFTNNTSDLAITFTYRNEGTTSSNGTIIVGYMSDPDDANTFEPVLTCDRTTTLTTKTATFTGAPNGSYIAFKYQGGTSSNYYASIDDVIVYVPTVIEKTIEAKKWYAISSPVHNSGNNETLDGVIGLTTTGTDFAYDLYGYTESAGTWNAPTFLEQGKGYIYRRSEDTTLRFVGIANNSVPDYTLSYACEDNDLKGFNLVGNPYPLPATCNMPCYRLTTTGTWHAELESYNVPVCEAVLVKTNGTGNHVSFTTSSAMSATNAPALAFTVSNGEYSDVAYARFENGNSLPKIGHLNSEAPMLSIPVEGRRYAIANLGSDCQSFNLVFRGVNGTYTIKQSSNQAIAYCHLIDRVAGKEIDMLRQPSYTFSSNGFDADRFMVKLSPDAQENANGNFAYWNGNSWMVEGNGMLQVFDALGRQLFSQEISNSNFEIQNSLFPAAGVYVLRMGEKTQKIVVR